MSLLWSPALPANYYRLLLPPLCLIQRDATLCLTRTDSLSADYVHIVLSLSSASSSIPSIRHEVLMGRHRQDEESERSQTEIRLRFQSSLTTTCNGPTAIDCPLIPSTCKKGRGRRESGIDWSTEGNSTLIPGDQRADLDSFLPSIPSLAPCSLPDPESRVTCSPTPAPTRSNTRQGQHDHDTDSGKPLP